jgi:hypothetical protein
VRTNLVAVADIEQRKTNEMTGAELGYHYAGSQLVATEPGEPPYDYIDYRPSTFPGVRLPHTWLDDGRATQDCIGDGFTLLRLGGAHIDVGALATAFQQIGAPFATLDLPGMAARDIYGYDLILVRPDLHVVWRGNRPPQAPSTLAALATGHAK